MSKRAYAANMMSQDTQQFNGFLKGLWNPKSESNSTELNFLSFFLFSF